PRTPKGTRPTLNRTGRSRSGQTPTTRPTTTSTTSEPAAASVATELDKFGSGGRVIERMDPSRLPSAVRLGYFRTRVAGIAERNRNRIGKKRDDTLGLLFAEV